MIIPYHILNGDALKAQFPKQLSGEIMVARECLVDGEVGGESLGEFFQTRARFICSFYGAYTPEEYYRDSVTEFNKIMAIPSGSDIFLWFEDDLFCQVNFWFTVHLINAHVRQPNVYLVRPEVHTPYGFGGLSGAELITAFENRIRLYALKEIGGLWKAYQRNDTAALVRQAETLKDRFPYIHRAIEAHLERIPDEHSPGRPVQVLTEIMHKLGTEEFGPVFREFNRRESIYGFGDLQVKRLFDQIKNEQ